MAFSNWMEKKGVSRGLSSLLSVLTFVFVIAAIFTLVGWQVSNISKDAAKIEKNLSTKISELRHSISSSLGVSEEKQQEVVKKQQSQSGGGLGKAVTAIMSSAMSILVDTVLMLVYLFLLLYFRGHLKKFVLKLVPETGKPKTKKIVTESSRVAQKYLSGLGMMIVMLWIMYGIGFSIVGVKHAIFFAILCGLLEIIPFVGNLAGTLLTMLMAFAQGGGTNLLLGILITYAIVQFVQTYVLEPLVVGAEVNLNPLFTILLIVIGETVWGVAGMVLAIPVAGIMKIIFDNVPVLQPYGYLIGKEQENDKGNGLKEKIKKLFKK
jgi:predicted PurR-regulated permease PerM